MKSAGPILASILTLAACVDPACAQVVAPNLPPPPCTGRNCLNPPRGAATPHQSGTSMPKCPPGTLFVPKTGTCKVFTN